MAIRWQSDRDFKDLKKDRVIKANVPFEETIKRVEEIEDNIKRDYNIDINIERLDEDDE